MRVGTASCGVKGLGLVVNLLLPLGLFFLEGAGNLMRKRTALFSVDLIQKNVETKRI